MQYGFEQPSWEYMPLVQRTFDHIASLALQETIRTPILYFSATLCIEGGYLVQISSEFNFYLSRFPLRVISGMIPSDLGLKQRLHQFSAWAVLSRLHRFATRTLHPHSCILQIWVNLRFQYFRQKWHRLCWYRGYCIWFLLQVVLQRLL